MSPTEQAVAGRVLDGKVALVTGAARGIGRATAELLVAHGANVLLSDFDGDRLRLASDQIDGTTGAFAGDITERGVPEALVQTALATWGGLDIIVTTRATA
jgi:3-oxoacyl-[acyl-carrier protein] reductase